MLTKMEFKYKTRRIASKRRKMNKAVRNQRETKLVKRIDELNNQRVYHRKKNS